jgi:hypothetical protein
MSFLGGVGSQGLFGFGQGYLDEAGNQPNNNGENALWSGQMGMTSAERYHQRADARTAQQLGDVREARYAKQNADMQKQANPLDASFAQGLATNQSTSAVDWHDMQKDIYG